jgi:hypothetical protein
MLLYIRTEENKLSHDYKTAPIIINFDQQPAYNSNISFKKPYSIWDFDKIISSYNFNGFKKDKSNSNVTIKHTIDMKKKKIVYTLAFRY